MWVIKLIVFLLVFSSSTFHYKRPKGSFSLHKAHDNLLNSTYDENKRSEGGYFYREEILLRIPVSSQLDFQDLHLDFEMQKVRTFLDAEIWKMQIKLMLRVGIAKCQSVRSETHICRCVIFTCLA